MRVKGVVCASREAAGLRALRRLLGAHTLQAAARAPERDWATHLCVLRGFFCLLQLWGGVERAASAMSRCSKGYTPQQQHAHLLGQFQVAGMRQHLLVGGLATATEGGEGDEQEDPRNEQQEPRCRDFHYGACVQEPRCRDLELRSLCTGALEVDF